MENPKVSAATHALLQRLIGEGKVTGVRVDDPHGLFDPRVAFIPFQRRVARAGMVNSLSQRVLKLASPGVADFYQGSELWDLSLVDPDSGLQTAASWQCREETRG